jgi:hypothetical protein
MASQVSIGSLSSSGSTVNSAAVTAGRDHAAVEQRDGVARGVDVHGHRVAGVDIHVVRLWPPPNHPFGSDIDCHSGNRGGVQIGGYRVSCDLEL